LQEKVCPLKNQKLAYELPAEPEKCAILRRGHELIPLTFAEAEIMRASCDAKKIRSLIKVFTKDHDTQWLPLYVEFSDANVSGSNFSSRMSPPVPIRKGALKKSENGRRHKVKTYRKPGNSAYDALLSSGNFVPARELGYMGIHTHRHKTFGGHPAQSCYACAVHGWKYSERLSPPEKTLKETTENAARVQLLQSEYRKHIETLETASRESHNI
jgi:hypothetical protein